MIFRGHFQNGVVIPTEPIDLPDGAEVNIELVSSAKRQTLAEEFADLIGSVPDLPEDMASQHDHYIRGTPKR